jgi:hypothetical protein
VLTGAETFYRRQDQIFNQEFSMRISALVFFILMPFQSLADTYCDDLWFGRNLVFDRAGYCFGSPLGKAMFNNGDCTTKKPVLSEYDREFVEFVEWSEEIAHCKVDTSQRSIAIELIELRRKLMTPVIRANILHNCQGWRRGPLELHAANSANSPVIGRIETGDDFTWYFTNQGEQIDSGWDILMGFRDGKAFTLGWTNGTGLVKLDDCRAFTETGA